MTTQIALILRLWSSSPAFDRVCNVDEPAIVDVATDNAVQASRAKLAASDDGGTIDLTKPVDYYGLTTSPGAQVSR